jgi:hypothetical protein
MNLRVDTPDSRILRAIGTDGLFEGFTVVSRNPIVIEIPDSWETSRVLADMARLRAQGLILTVV